MNQASDTLANNEDQMAETDSAKFMQYIEYISQTEDIDVYNYDLSTLSKIEKNRDTAIK